MGIVHTALYVRDLEAAKGFFVRFFGAQSGSKYTNPTTGFESYFLRFDQGAQLELMTRPEAKAASGTPFAAGYAHVAFGVGSKERVDRLTKELRAAGYAVESGPRTTGDGYYESCVVGPEGNRIEVTV